MYCGAGVLRVVLQFSDLWAALATMVVASMPEVTGRSTPSFRWKGWWNGVLPECCDGVNGSGGGGVLEPWR
eukprot:196902-Alexandrium_andersonii.AAC.1